MAGIGYGGTRRGYHGVFRGRCRRCAPGWTPACAGTGGRGETAEHHVAHGVSVWLCPPHRTPAFLRRRCGRTFTARLEAIWHANGMATRRRLAALHAHRRRMNPPQPACPPRLLLLAAHASRSRTQVRSRRHAHDAISDLRGHHDDLPATASSMTPDDRARACPSVPWTASDWACISRWVACEAAHWATPRPRLPCQSCWLRSLIRHEHDRATRTLDPPPSLRKRPRRPLTQCDAEP